MFELLAAALLHCAVVKVHDGDTLTAFCPKEGKIRVRLYCIDAPELAQKPWGYRARDRLRELAGREVTIVPITRDQYGRMVGIVQKRRSGNLNLKLVEEGWAAVYERYCKDRAFYEAQEQARRFKRGIWQVAGLHQRPWEFRRSRRLASREESFRKGGGDRQRPVWPDGRDRPQPPLWERLLSQLRELAERLFR